MSGTCNSFHIIKVLQAEYLELRSQGVASAMKFTLYLLGFMVFLIRFLWTSLYLSFHPFCKKVNQPLYIIHSVLTSIVAVKI